MTADRVAVITGGNSGIGLHAATGLARRGWALHIAARDTNRAQVAASQISAETGHTPVQHAVDLGSLASVASLIEALDGPVDALLCNAGTSWDGPLRWTSDGPSTTRR